MKEKFLNLLLVIICTTLIISCKVRTPKGILSESQLEKLLYDYHRAQILSMSDDSADYKLKVYTDAVLAKYKFSYDDFDRNMVWYSRHADKLYKVYENVNQRLENETKIFGASSNKLKIGDFSDMLAYGDTANIWNGQDKGLLVPRAGCNLFSFSLEPDSLCKPLDKIEWHFKSKFIYKSGKKSAIAVLAVRYENDSITTVKYPIYGQDENVLALSTVNLPIKQIEGFIYLEETLNTEAKLMFISNFALIRFHDLTSENNKQKDTDTLNVQKEKEKQKDAFIDSIQNSSTSNKNENHFRTVTRKREMPHKKEFKK